MAGKSVHVYAIRHGEYGDNGQLTARGCKQIKQAARQLPSDLVFDAAFHSGKPRAKQTAEIILRETDRPLCQLVEDEAFDYDWVDQAAVIEVTWPDDYFETAQGYLQAWPPAWAIMARAREAMFKVAAHIVRDVPFESRQHYNILIAAHSPVLELMASIAGQPAVKLMSQADIILFELVTVPSTAMAKITVTRLLPLQIPTSSD